VSASALKMEKTCCKRFESQKAIDAAKTAIAADA